jgi:hypothetical protein
MDAEARTTTTSTPPPVALALGALGADLAVLFLPINDGSSLLSSMLSPPLAGRAKVAIVLSSFAVSVAILVGLAFLRRGRAAVAAGVFIGLFVVLALRVVASALTSIDGWVWQTTVVLGLQTVECVLLLLAARAARASSAA